SLAPARAARRRQTLGLPRKRRPQYRRASLLRETGLSPRLDPDVPAAGSVGSGASDRARGTKSTSRDPLARRRPRRARTVKLLDLLHGKWLGHPLHPAIVHVPIGLWTVACVLDVIVWFVPDWVVLARLAQ